MLKTNSKAATANIRRYIMNNFDCSSYEPAQEPQTWQEIAAYTLATFRNEKYNSINDFRYYHGNEQAAFADWCAGLPSILDTCYYYNRSAVDDLGAILEETDSEKNRYSEEEAETMLTRLIYRELLKGEEKK